jgi:hypothetical protein
MRSAAIVMGGVLLFASASATASPGAWDGTYTYAFGSADVLNTNNRCARNDDAVATPTCKKIFKQADDRSYVVAPLGCLHFTDERDGFLCPTECGNLSEYTIAKDVLSFDVQYYAAGAEGDADRHRETRHISIPLKSKNRNEFEVDVTLPLSPPFKRGGKVINELHFGGEFKKVSSTCSTDNVAEHGHSGSFIIRFGEKGHSTDDGEGCGMRISGPDYKFVSNCEEAPKSCKANLVNCNSAAECCSGHCNPVRGFKFGRCESR